jgi:hypothetical protein
VPDAHYEHLTTPYVSRALNVQALGNYKTEAFNALQTSCASPTVSPQKRSCDASSKGTRSDCYAANQLRQALS